MRLCVEKAIGIDAPAARVWEALTSSDLARQWIGTWWPDVTALESDWRAGSPVRWAVSGETGAEGVVLISKPHALLRFSFQVAGADKREEITYVLVERGGRTVLRVSVGDFSDTPEHEACYPGAVEAWEKSLPKIKDLAETLK